MGTYFSQADLERLRDLRAVLIGIEGRPDGEDAPRYWTSRRDIELYDQVFAARIGWKWDAVLDECALRCPLPAPATVLDWGTGTGVAARTLLGRIAGVERVVLFDRDEAALAFAAESVRAAFPTVEVEATTRAPEGSFDLILASHVLDELDAHDEAVLHATLRAGARVLWVEPGSRVTSRRLSAARDALGDAFDVLAPCTHGEACGMLAPERRRDWCHFFAKPPAEVHTTGTWSEIHRELKIDLRSLPYAFLALQAKGAGAPDHPTAARLLGRPRVQRGRVLLDLCDAGGVRETQMLQRTDKALFRSLKKTAGEVVLLKEDDGSFERVVLP